MTEEIDVDQPPESGVFAAPSETAMKKVVADLSKDFRLVKKNPQRSHESKETIKRDKKTVKRETKQIRKTDRNQHSSEHSKSQL